MNRKVALGALLVLLVLCLFGLSLAVGASSGSGRGSGSGAVGEGGRDALGTLQSGLRALPGVGHDLDAEELRQANPGLGCFDAADSTFTVDGPVPCRFSVPEGIDRVRLERRGGSCRVTVSDQPGVFDSRSDSPDWENGRTDLSLTGDGATVAVTRPFPVGDEPPCVLGLDP